MEFQNEKSLCFICAENVEQSFVAQKSTKSSCSKLFFEFFSFAQRYLKLNTASWCHDTKFEVICESCLVKVKHVCGLYEGLCAVELRLSSTLGELGRLLKQPRENVSVHKDSQKVNVNGIRGFVAAKCLEKFKNSGSQKSGSDLEEKSENRPEELVLPEENAEADCLKMDPDEREVEYIWVEKEEDDYKDESLLDLEHDPLSISLPTVNIQDFQEEEDDTFDEVSSNIDVDPNSEEDDDDNNLLEERTTDSGAVKNTFFKLYQKVRKLRRDSDKESEYGSDADVDDFEPGSDKSWCSNDEFSDDEDNLEEPQKKHRKLSEACNVASCEQCNRPFSNVGHLLTHLQWHEKQLGEQQASNSCYFCNKSFCLMQSLQLHMQHHATIMGTGKPFECDDKDCGASFESCQDLNNHLATHSKPVSHCFSCHWGFLDADNLILHEVIHIPNNKGYQCRICDFKTNFIKSLETHCFRKHTSSGAKMEYFICKVCGADFSKYSGLCKHMKRFNHGNQRKPVRTQSCHHCNARFYLQTDLQKHISEKCEKNPEIDRELLSLKKLEKKVICHICSRPIVKHHIEKHLQTHLPKEPKPTKKKEREPAVCGICGDSFPSKKARRSHVSKVHTANREKTKVQCEECGKAFCSQFFLRKHTDNVHKGIDASVVCDLCGKVLKNPDNLRSHMITHAEEKRHGCHLCPNRYRGRQILRKHLVRDHGKTKGEEFTPGEGVVFKCVCMFPSCTAKFETDVELQSHVGQRHSSPGGKFICPVCGKVFSNQARLTRHNLVHSKEKPHACTVCSQSFAYRASLKDHLQAVHSIGGEEEYFSCKFQNCTAKFKIHKYLTKHLKRKHGFTVAPVKSESTTLL